MVSTHSLTGTGQSAGKLAESVAAWRSARNWEWPERVAFHYSLPVQQLAASNKPNMFKVAPKGVHADDAFWKAVTGKFFDFFQNKQTKNLKLGLDHTAAVLGGSGLVWSGRWVGGSEEEKKKTREAACAEGTNSNWARLASVVE